MDNKKLIEIYNESLSQALIHLKVSHFNELNKFSINDLRVLFTLFSDKIAEKGVDSNGNITAQGISMDHIAGKINTVILSKK